MTVAPVCGKPMCFGSCRACGVDACDAGCPGFCAMDSDGEWSELQRCDECNRYEGDSEAIAAARLAGLEIVVGPVAEGEREMGMVEDVAWSAWLARVRPMADPPRSIAACSGCGSTDVEIVVWCGANTDEPSDGYGSSDEADTEWCPECEEHGTIEFRSATAEEVRAIYARRRAFALSELRRRAPDAYDALPAAIRAEVEPPSTAEPGAS